jgi:SAM-dependent methyltransferase
MEAEFGTVAEWTAEVAADLGREYFVPAACRGSGSPTTLRWLIERLAISSRDRMLDCGAGVGGPAAFAAELTGVVPLLSDPEAGACRAARRLFGFPVVQAASEQPFMSGIFTVAWSLGVLCTVDEQFGFLRELRRVLTPAGRLGLLVFVAYGSLRRKAPAGNNFPQWNELLDLLSAAGFTVDTAACEADQATAPAHWQDRADQVHEELARRHAQDERWLVSAEQSALIGELLKRREVNATAIIASPMPHDHGHVDEAR